MHIKYDSQSLAKIETPALVTYAFEHDNRIEGALGELDAAIGGRLRKIADAGELTGKTLEMTMLHVHGASGPTRVLVVGAGKADKFDTAILRRIAAAALRHLKARSVKSLVFALREGQLTAAAAQAVTEGLLLGAYDSDSYKSEKKAGAAFESAALAGFGAEQAEAEKGIARGRIIAEAQNFARELVNEPSNKLTPRILADRAVAMAREAGLAVEILDEKRITELKMGALLGVAQGSDEPPRVMVLTYTPANPRPGAPVLGLIGKAVTFDTGGISIKPAEGMEKMKYDMGGGGAMLGAMRAISALKPSVKVICVVPSVENMPGHRAQKPGDVVIAMSGKSIEVINTDAEGRLILADAITYAKQLGCTHLIDAATLTGAIVVALANVNVGAFTNNQPLMDRLLASAKNAGEKIWPMPLDDEYSDFIKSNIADIQNIGSGKGGGAITAAAFIREFVGDTPWVHLDIAGTAWLDEGKPWSAKGPTGVPVRTMVDLAMNFQ